MREEQKGELFIFSGAVIWGLFPIITILSYKSLPSIISLALCTLLASITFLIIVLWKRKLPELKNPLLWKYTLGVAFFNGILYYVFYFWGLTKTTSGNAGIIALFEVFTSYIFFHIIRKEHFSLESKIGSILMILGAVIILIPNFSFVNFGDLFILIATLFAPMGNFFIQKAKNISSTETIMFLRNLIAIPFLFLIAFIFGQHLELPQVKNSFLFLLLNGLIILGLSKIFWVEGISRISVTKSVALSSVAPLFTLFAAWVVFHQVPTIWQTASLAPFFFGVLLLTNNLKLKNDYASPN
ncbi:MAG TPA: DMT family transporter [Candidatus Paceibacterota bacterium]